MTSMTPKTFWMASCIVGISLAAMGCGGAAYEYDSVVTGTVTIDGNLANTGTVTFHPVKSGRPAMGRIHSDGSYSLRTGQGDLSQVDGGTVKSGEYLVTASITAPPAEGAVTGEGGPPIPGPSLVASKYRQRDTTDLRLTVKPGTQVITLDLEPAEADQESDTTAKASSEDEQASPEGESQTTESAPATSPEDGEPSDQSDTPAESNTQPDGTVPDSQTE
jgi:hypothetical protein